MSFDYLFLFYFSHKFTPCILLTCFSISSFSSVSECTIVFCLKNSLNTYMLLFEEKCSYQPLLYAIFSDQNTNKQLESRIKNDEDLALKKKFVYKCTEKHIYARTTRIRLKLLIIMQSL